MLVDVWQQVQQDLLRTPLPCVVDTATILAAAAEVPPMEKHVFDLLAAIPRDASLWFTDEEAIGKHPQKLFYSYETMLTPKFKAWFKEFLALISLYISRVDCSSPTLPDQSGRRGQLVRGLLTKEPTQVRAVRYPTSNKCIKCNRFFYSKNGGAVGELAFYICEDGPCSEIYADKCIKCMVLYWITSVLSPGRLRTKAGTWDTRELLKHPKVKCKCGAHHHWNLLNLYALEPK